jgi:hypothetical protein
VTSRSGRARRWASIALMAIVTVGLSLLSVEGRAMGASPGHVGSHCVSGRDATVHSASTPVLPSDVTTHRSRMQIGATFRC